MEAVESIQELASRIRHDAVTCDFQSVKDPLDEALRTRFICFVDNEAALNALFNSGMMSLHVHSRGQSR